MLVALRHHIMGAGERNLASMAGLDYYTLCVSSHGLW